MARTLLNSLERNALYYNYLNILVGSQNYLYDKKFQYYRLDNKPTLLYSIVLNALYLLVIPYMAKSVFVKFRSCLLSNLILYINWITSILNICAFLVTITVLWYRRRQLCALSNDVLRLLRILAHEAEVSEGLRRIMLMAKRLLLIKSVTVFVIYFHSIEWIFASTKQGCTDKPQAINISFFISVIIAAITLSTKLLAAHNVYTGMLQGNMLLSGWLHEMTVIRKEVHSLIAEERRLQRTPRWHAIHWAQLLQHSKRIVHQQRATKDFIWGFMSCQQPHLLVSHISLFINSIQLAFNIVLAMNTANKGTAYLLATFLVKLGNIVMLFYECEGIQRHFVEMPQVIFEIRQQLSTTKQCQARKELSQMLEMFSLQLKQNNCKLLVCGFFDLNMGTAIGMIAGVVLHLLLLMQYAFLDFEKEMNDQKAQNI